MDACGGLVHCMRLVRLALAQVSLIATFARHVTTLLSTSVVLGRKRKASVQTILVGVHSDSKGVPAFTSTVLEESRVRLGSR